MRGRMLPLNSGLEDVLSLREIWPPPKHSFGCIRFEFGHRNCGWYNCGEYICGFRYYNCGVITYGLVQYWLQNQGLHKLQILYKFVSWQILPISCFVGILNVHKSDINLARLLHPRAQQTDTFFSSNVKPSLDQGNSYRAKWKEALTVSVNSLNLDMKQLLYHRQE
jgi:hypothetical protein